MLNILISTRRIQSHTHHSTTSSSTVVSKLTCTRTQISYIAVSTSCKQDCRQQRAYQRNLISRKIFIATTSKVVHKHVTRSAQLTKTSKQSQRPSPNLSRTFRSFPQLSTAQRSTGNPSPICQALRTLFQHQASRKEGPTPHYSTSVISQSNFPAPRIQVAIWDAGIAGK